MWDRVVFKDRAKAIMKEHYWKVFIACLIASLLGITASDGSSSRLKFNSDSGFSLNLNYGPFDYSLPMTRFTAAISILVIFMAVLAIVAAVVLGAFVFNILRVGFCRYLVLTQKHGHPAEIGEIFWGFGCGHYLNLVQTMFFHDLYIFLWSLALVIPGIIKSYEYTCVPYILAEHPEMHYREVLELSQTMTDGYKMDIWILGLSFLGWSLLGTLLFGIGVFFVTPYVELTNGEMYAFLRSRIEPQNGGDGYHEYRSSDYSQEYSQGYHY